MIAFRTHACAMFRVPPHLEDEACHQDWAIPAIFYTAHKDSLTAAYSAVASAAAMHGLDHPRFFRELREAFPGLDI